ncbi:MAG: ABC transporter ATP-binding protein, partial [Epsilonproteobacteria bacterium]|nr:ABC transporter ATP-binding protein [Campylobacterota bacterium]
MEIGEEKRVGIRTFFKKVWGILGKRDKIFIGILLLFSFFISLIEVGGVGVIMPFIAISTNFEKIKHYFVFDYLYQTFNFQSPIYFTIFVGVILITFYLFRGILNFFYFYLLARFSFGRYHFIAYRLFEKYLEFEYLQFIKKNSSEIIKTIVNEAQNFVLLLSQLLFMVSEIFILLIIYIFLLWLNWKMTLILTLFLGINLYLMKRTISTKIQQQGKIREKMNLQFYKIIHSSLGNFKMIKLKGNEKELLEKFQKASYEAANANITHKALSEFPRIFLETLGFIIVIGMIIYLLFKYQREITPDLPVLTIFILGLYRMLPSVNRIYRSFNHILFTLPALEIIHSELSYPVEKLGNEPIKFNHKIVLENIHFSYEKDKPVLKGVNLEIKKGEKIGILGESGCGKSTLLDIIIGIYKPQKGKVIIDNTLLTEKNVKSWRKKIGYIPQNIYLIDGSVAENVAFGEKIDRKKVREALKKAKLLEFLEKNHQGIDTQIGENGIKLSGGQRQRIAIARAIYNNPEVLVLDEATSALDPETEKEIMDEIYKIGENKT